ncbi:MAG: hypothetical protein ACOZQL_05545 [Myxococcota bacterium]
MTISKISRAVTAPELKAQEPRPSAPKVARPAASTPESSFEAPRRNPVALNPSEGRGCGTNDDSLGRGKGTNDDSIGRGKGTNDDSIGRGKGTNDDSIGRGKGTNDDSIGRAGQGRLTRELDRLGAPRPAPTTPVDTSTLGLDAAARAKVETLLKNPAIAGDVAFAVRSESFQKLDAGQKQKFVDVLAATGANGARLLAIECETGADLSAPRAVDGSTALDHLDRMTKAGLIDGALEVMADVIIPDRIWQGDAPTCTASTMQYELAKDNAGEYARLMAGLALEGHVDMAGGGRLTVDVDHALRASRNADDGRSPTEAVFQAAVMDFANGRDAYDLDRMESTRQLGTERRTYRGLYGDQIRDMLGQLFGTRYETTRINTNDDAMRVLPQLQRSEQPNRPVLIDLVVNERQNHCVAFEGVKGDLVLLRDPQNGRRITISKQEFYDSAAAVHIAADTSDVDWSVPRKGKLLTQVIE